MWSGVGQGFETGERVAPMAASIVAPGPQMCVYFHMISHDSPHVSAAITCRLMHRLMHRLTPLLPFVFRSRPAGLAYPPPTLPPLHPTNKPLCPFASWVDTTNSTGSSAHTWRCSMSTVPCSVTGWTSKCSWFLRRGVYALAEQQQSNSRATAEH